MNQNNNDHASQFLSDYAVTAKNLIEIFANSEKAWESLAKQILLKKRASCQFGGSRFQFQYGSHDFADRQTALGTASLKIH